MDSRATRNIGSGGPGPGRPKGSRNRITRELKEMILGALEAQDGGGIGYLARQAEENPRAFLALLAKLLPKQPEPDTSPLGRFTVITGIDPTLGEPGQDR